MFGPWWSTSQRQFGVRHDQHVRVPMRDGVELAADVFRPQAEARFPAIIGYHAYDPIGQWAPITPRAFGSREPAEKQAGPLEAGDPNFFVRRGYAHVIANVRGTSDSAGTYPFLADPEPLDGYDLIEWVARQPWCDGNVGMFGMSYFGRIQYFVAATQPPHLKCLFAPWSSTDLYRDSLYHGGILAKNWAQNWGRVIAAHHYESESRREWGAERFEAALDQALSDPDLRAEPGLITALQAVRRGAGGELVRENLLADIVLNPLDGPFWEKRKARYQDIRVPVYTGADWGIYGLHLPAAFRSWAQLQTPKKMLIGPQAYVERPIYQLQYESLRWFDYWLKGLDTHIMDEPNVRMFITQTRQWRAAETWPLPETRWTPFYLHEGGLLWEHEYYPHEGCSSFNDSPYGRGALEFSTPRLVEETELIGPISVNLFASTSSDDEILWVISLHEVDAEGKRRELTRGWLRGSHRAVDPARSEPWAPHHPHDHAEPLEAGKVYEFQIGLVPTGQLLRAGSRLVLRVSCTDDEPKNAQENLASGHLRRQMTSRITVFHNDEYPSHVLLPITAGNVIGTYLTEGAPYF